mgnify:CR=1 FL=1
MSKPQQTDAVDALIAQWNRERPDLDVTPMATIGRLKRCSALVQRRLDATFSQFGMSSWEFDVLATLRRSGEPYCLAPTTLFSMLMITSGTMTHRMQQLEKHGLVERISNPEDARSKLVKLTDKGFELIDQAVTAHVENEHRILAALNAEQHQDLNQSLTRLMAILESE